MNQQVNYDAIQAMIQAGDISGASALFSGAPALAKVAQYQQPQQPQMQPVPPAQAPQSNLEQRVTQLEQLVKQAAVPVMDEAAKIGAAIMSALGNGMNHEQAAFVQAKLNSSPEFFASQACKDAIDIFISEWKSYEGGKK